MLEKNHSWLILCAGMAWLFSCACVPGNQISRLPCRTVTGSVVDGSGQSVKQAVVTTDPPTSTLLTDDLGKFVITNLPEGVYTIQVAKQGFTVNSAVIAMKGLGPFHVDIQLTKRLLSSPVEQEKLLPQIHTKPKDTKGDGSSWWPATK